MKKTSPTPALPLLAGPGEGGSRFLVAMLRVATLRRTLPRPVQDREHKHRAGKKPCLSPGKPAAG